MSYSGKLDGIGRNATVHLFSDCLSLCDGHNVVKIALSELMPTYHSALATSSLNFHEVCEGDLVAIIQTHQPQVFSSNYLTHSADWQSPEFYKEPENSRWKWNSQRFSRVSIKIEFTQVVSWFGAVASTSLPTAIIWKQLRSSNEMCTYLLNLASTHIDLLPCEA